MMSKLPRHMNSQTCFADSGSISPKKTTATISMRLGLIAMSGVRVKSPELAALGVTLPGFVRRGKVIASLPSLGLLTVAGLTPPKHEVSYIEVADLRSHPTLPDFDLVAISSMTAQIR